MSLEMVERIVLQGNPANDLPGKIFEDILNSTNSADRIWNIISNQSFGLQMYWKVLFFQRLPASFVNTRYTHLLLETVDEVNKPISIFIGDFIKFTKIDPLISRP